MKIVIIGAGQTGRGFIAPLLMDNQVDITFIDKDEDLIWILNKEGKYEVNYFDNNSSIEINDYDAYHISSQEALVSLAESDIVFISVFPKNFPFVSHILQESTLIRTKKEKMIIVLAENGVNLKEKLGVYNINADITEGIIFCTSVLEENSLNIKSEKTESLPINGFKLESHFTLKNFPIIYNFDILIKRKIYTYNFLSAVIAYTGYYLNYHYLYEAANDSRVIRMIEQIRSILNQEISKLYNVDIQEQENFFQNALNKFRNRGIVDTIERNAQQVVRKLGKEERLIFPLNLLPSNTVASRIIAFVCALAIIYGIEEEDLEIQYVEHELKTNINLEENYAKTNSYVDILMKSDHDSEKLIEIIYGEIDTN